MRNRKTVKDQLPMVKYLLYVLLLLPISCSPPPVRRTDQAYHPKVGDSKLLVETRIGSPYFGYRGPARGTIVGYLYDPSEERYSGYGTDMIDENKEGLKVVLIYYENYVVRDLITLEGGVAAGGLLDGSGRGLFLRKWRSVAPKRH